jgi:hypothetical protein
MGNKQLLFPIFANELTEEGIGSDNHGWGCPPLPVPDFCRFGHFLLVLSPKEAADEEEAGL